MLHLLFLVYYLTFFPPFTLFSNYSLMCHIVSLCLCKMFSQPRIASCCSPGKPDSSFKSQFKCSSVNFSLIPRLRQMWSSLALRILYTWVTFILALLIQPCNYFSLFLSYETVKSLWKRQLFLFLFVIPRLAHCLTFNRIFLSMLNTVWICQQS